MKTDIPRAGPWLLAGFLVATCTGSGETETSALPESAPVDSVAAAESVTAEWAPDSIEPNPFAGFQLEATPEVSASPRRLRLLLRNDASSTAVVRADGGAGEVVLDSVPPESLRRVDVLTRAPVVTLRARTTDGRALRTIDVAVGADSLTEVLVGAPGGP